MAKPDKSENLIAEARRLYQAGDGAKAEAICRQVLAQSPLTDAAWQFMGIMALDVNRDDLAVSLFMRALDVAPQKAGYYVNLAVGLHRLGKLREAADALRLAISLQPDLAEAHFNLGRCLSDFGEFDEAFVEVETAARYKPDSCEIQRHFARMLTLRGESERALGAYRRALENEPTSVECLRELSGVMRGLSQASDAVEFARRATALQPNSAVVLSELGLALLLDDQSDEALDVLKRALQIDPNSVEVLCGLGAAYESIGSLEASIAHFRRALSLDPSLHRAHSNIAFLMQFVPGVEPSAILEEARVWDRNYALPFRANLVPHANARVSERRLRVGYVSAHFYNHCQSLFTTPLFRHHNHANFEIIAYSCVDNPDKTTSTLRGMVDVWRDVNRVDEGELAEIIRRDSVDVLVDLAMHMGNSRLLAFARKPAPVQLSWLAYPGTTGLTEMDYRITDRYLDPPELSLEHSYSEQSIVLPESFWCYDPLTVGLGVGPVPALANGFITFGCLNHFRKLNRPQLLLWAEVLKRVEGSRLLLLAPEGIVRRDIRSIFEQVGVSGSRLMFEARGSRPEYLGLYRRIDVCLDTHPYSGHTTSMDAFWCGVPVISLVGPLVVGRAAITIARNLALDELATFRESEFIRIAVDWAMDLQRLAELRKGLTARMQASPLMNGARFATLLESAYRLAWRNWCSEGRAAERGSGPLMVSG